MSDDMNKSSFGDSCGCTSSDCASCGGCGDSTPHTITLTMEELEQMENDPRQVFKSFCREEMGEEATPHFVELFEKAVSRYEEGTV